MSDSMLEVKRQIAEHATEYYGKYVSPYEFIMAQIDKSEFTIAQLFQDTSSSGVLNVNMNSIFIFAYQINKNALNY